MIPKLILTGALCALLACSGMGAVVSDGALGPGAVGSSPGNYAIPRSAGLLKGANLFHSFSQFNLLSGEIATFNDLSGVTNVLARVTGGPSSIDGRISCAANLFLINPRGLTFGPNATLDVTGSFVASTADYVKLTDGAKFNALATVDELVTLTAAPVSAFGFLGTSPAAVTFTESRLVVGTQQDLSVVAGNITLDGATLHAPSGGLSVASVAGAGEVPHGAAALAATAAAVVPVMGEIRMKNGAAAKIDGAGGGKVVIRGGKLVIEGASVVSSVNSGAVAGGDADVRVTGDVNILGGGYIEVSASGSGKGGDSTVHAKNLTIDGTTVTDFATGIFGIANAGSSGDAGLLNITVDELLSIKSGSGSGMIMVSTWGSGKGGELTVHAKNLTIDGQLSPYRSGIVGDSQVGSSGDARLMNITVDELLSISSGAATISLSTGGSGKGGDLTVHAKNLTVSEGGTIGGETASTGNAAFINIAVDELFSISGAASRVSVSTYGSGKGGDLTLHAKNLTVSERGSITGESGSTGNAGFVNIAVDELFSIGPRGIVSVSTLGSGKGGDLTLHAKNLTIDGTTAENGQTGIIGVAQAGSSGDAGLMNITVDELLLISVRAEISTFTRGSGKGGDLTVRAKNLTIYGASTPGDFTGIAGSAEPGSSGDPGATNITVDELLSISRGGQISVQTYGSGTGGDLTVRAKNLTIDGTIAPGEFTGILGRAEAGSTGIAGQLTVNVSGELGLRGGGISAEAAGSGAAGGVQISADRVFLSDSGRVSVSANDARGGDILISARSVIELKSNSSITASAALGGGNITIQAPQRILLYDSTVSATARGTSTGGNISIDPQFLILNHATISANAALGQGGGILLQSENYLSSMSSVTATGSTAGSVQISAPKIDLSGALGGLSVQFVDGSTRLQERCAMRLGGDVSSFLVVGRGGIVSNPEGLLEETALWERRERR